MEASTIEQKNQAAAQEELLIESEDKEQFSCRMYENKYPEVDELVLVNVKSVAEMGAYVELLEYGNIEGMVLLSELSRRRIRSVNKLIRVGRQEVVVVLRVDTEKGYIDLSKRRVSPEDIQKCEEKFNKSKTVHSIMRHVAQTCNKKMIDLYEQFGWDLYRKYGHAYDALKILVSGSEEASSKLLAPYSLPEDVLSSLLTTVKRRLTPQPVRIRADIEVTCFGYEGVDAVKRALQKGEEASTENAPIKIQLVAPPLYVLLSTTLEKEEGLAAMKQAVEVIEKEIKASEGEIFVKSEPRVVSERDDKVLQALMENLEKQNQEVDGDAEAE